MRQYVEGYGFERIETNEDADHLGGPKDRGIHCPERQAVSFLGYEFLFRARGAGKFCPFADTLCVNAG